MFVILTLFVVALGLGVYLLFFLPYPSTASSTKRNKVDSTAGVYEDIEDYSIYDNDDQEYY